MQDGVFVATVHAYRDGDEIARIHIAANQRDHYYVVRDAVMGLPGVTRVEITAPGQKSVVYVPRRDGETLFPVWAKEEA